MKLPITKNDFDALREIPRLLECPPLTPALIEEITKNVFIPSNPQKSDVLFVFGSSYGDKWSQVIELWKQGFAPVVYIAGGVGDKSFTTGKILSHLIREEFILGGIPNEAIIVDERSKNTLEDAVFGKELFLRKDVPHERILFACKEPHSSRCLRALKKVFPTSTLFPFTYEFERDGQTIRTSDWWQSNFGRQHVWAEHQRIKLYSKRGDIC